MREKRPYLEGATVLTLGAKGALAGTPFTLTARTCVRGRRGAIWNEWVVACDDGKTYYLSESGDAFTLYDETPMVPDYEAVVPGEPFAAEFLVVERGEAQRVAQWGKTEKVASSYRYVDLSSKAIAKASVDYGDDVPRVFIGIDMTLAELELTARKEPRRFVPVPDVSRPKGVEVWLDVGDEGELDGVRWRVVGMVSRSVPNASDEDGDVRTRWDEYMLHEADAGVRWLVVADGHWSLAESVPLGRIEESPATAAYLEDTYELVSEATARVDWATGELSWEVAIGEETHVRDFLHAPHILTKEWTAHEVHWSRATYISPDVVARAFGKRALPKPLGRAPHQPR